MDVLCRSITINTAFLGQSQEGPDTGRPTVWGAGSDTVWSVAEGSRHRIDCGVHATSQGPRGARVCYIPGPLGSGVEIGGRDFPCRSQSISASLPATA